MTAILDTLSKTIILKIIIVLVVLSSSSCSGSSHDVIDIPLASPTAATSVTSSPYALSTSRQGYTTVIGTLIVRNPLNSMPAPDNAIYLVPFDAGNTSEVVPQTLPEDTIQAEVDEVTGNFSFPNVEMGSYIVIIRTAGNALVPARLLGKQDVVLVLIDDTELGQTMNLNHIILP